MTGAILLCCILLVVHSSIGLCDDGNSEKKTNNHEDVYQIEEVVVRGEVVDKDLKATSTTVLSNKEITSRIQITPLDIVSLSPGIVIDQ
jgi:iron complex outermembrane receptor protein